MMIKTMLQFGSSRSYHGSDETSLTPADRLVLCNLLVCFQLHCHMMIKTMLQFGSSRSYRGSDETSLTPADRLDLCNCLSSLSVSNCIIT